MFACPAQRGQMLPQGPAGQRCGRLRRPSKRQGQALRALRGLAFSPARLRPYLPPRRCSGAQSGPVRWWPCCAPSAPPFARFAHRAKGGRSRPVPLRCATACVEPGAGATGGVAESCRRWGLRARQFKCRPRGCSAPRGKGRRSYGAFAGGKERGSLSHSILKCRPGGHRPPAPPPCHRPAAPLRVALPIIPPGPASRVRPGSRGLPLTPAPVRR